ncbi:unnamed protein product [Notodromas monacha]|uniref:Claspin n=1 Tax=Notodromas monacha TaxID=399045 RepID=A0A7R9BE82_9CRUS|nr:unnamed protein product [Notodromas monacha]CAG0913734.1 unnamed protein product [Notodromas monacha]
MSNVTVSVPVETVGSREKVVSIHKNRDSGLEIDIVSDDALQLSEKNVDHEDPEDAPMPKSTDDGNALASEDEENLPYVRKRTGRVFDSEDEEEPVPTVESADEDATVTQDSDEILSSDDEASSVSKKENTLNPGSANEHLKSFEQGQEMSEEAKLDSESDVMSSDDEETLRFKKLLAQDDQSDEERAISTLPEDKLADISGRPIRRDVERMVRERQVSLPYHRAKTRSLGDFLKRRSNFRQSYGNGNDLISEMQKKEQELKAFYAVESEDEDDSESWTPGTSDKAPDVLNSVAEKLNEVQEAVEEVAEIDPISPMGRQPETEVSEVNVEKLPDAEVFEMTTKCEEPSVNQEVTSVLRQSSSDGPQQKSPSSKKRTRKDKLLSLLRLQEMDEQVRLRAENDDFVELDSGDEEVTGVDKFIKGFMHHMCPLEKKVVNVKPIVESAVEVLVVPTELESPSKIQKMKSRVALRCQLQKSLRSKKLSQKKEELLQRAIEEVDEGDDGDDEMEEEFVGDVEGSDSEEEEEEEDDVDDELRYVEPKARNRSKFIDDEADESDGEVEEGEAEEDASLLLEECEPEEESLGEKAENANLGLSKASSENSLFEPNNQVSSRFLTNSTDQTFYESGSKYLRSQPATDAQWRITKDGKLAFTTPATQESPEKSCMLKKLIGGTQMTPDDSDLVALCSGSFDTQNVVESEPLLLAETECPLLLMDSEQPNNTQSEVVLESEKSFSELGESRAPEVQSEAHVNESTSKRNLSDDSDDEEEIGARPRKQRRLFSLDDDEEEENERSVEVDGQRNEDSEEGDDFENDEELDDEEDEQRSVMYDSEENEIPEERVEEYKKKIRSEFFDAEAALSGSDDGSGDENDEGDSDGEVLHDLLATDDSDVPSTAKLRNQIAAVQMRQMLDEDARQLRVLQEIYLEDGDLHSDRQRERRFRWKNIDDNDENAVGVDVDDDVDEDEDQETVGTVRIVREKAEVVVESSEWRKERFNREKWKTEALQLENSLGPDPDLISSEGCNGDSQVTMSSKAMQIIQKLSSFDDNSNNTSDENKISLKRPSKKSFLTHSEDDLQRIANLTKSAATPELSVGPSKRGSNFVFSHVSPGDELKKAAKKKEGPRQATKVDRSFRRLTEDKKQSSIFKYFS